MANSVGNNRKNVFVENLTQLKTPTLYYDDVNPASRMCIMLLNVLQVPVEQKEINTLEIKPITTSIDSINVVYYVPTFVHDTMTLTSCHAILIYICEEWGEKKKHENLLPSDSRKRMLVLNRLFFNDSVALKRHSELMTNIIRQGYNNIDHVFHSQRILKLYEMLDMYLQESNYLAGNVLSIADIATVATVGALDLYIPVEDNQTSYPKLFAWFETMRSLPMYRATSKGLKKQIAFMEVFGEFKFPNQKRDSLSNCYLNTQECKCSPQATKDNIINQYNGKKGDVEVEEQKIIGCKCSSKAEKTTSDLRDIVYESSSPRNEDHSNKSEVNEPEHKISDASACKCSSEVNEPERKISDASACKCSSEVNGTEHRISVASGYNPSSEVNEPEQRNSEACCCKCSSEDKGPKKRISDASACKCSSEVNEPTHKISDASACKCSSEVNGPEHRISVASGYNPSSEVNEPEQRNSEACCCKCSSEENGPEERISDASGRKRSSEVNDPEHQISDASACKCSSEMNEPEQRISEASACKCSFEVNKPEHQISEANACMCSSEVNEPERRISEASGCKCSSQAEETNKVSSELVNKSTPRKNSKSTNEHESKTCMCSISEEEKKQEEKENITLEGNGFKYSPQAEENNKILRNSFNKSFPQKYSRSSNKYEPNNGKRSSKTEEKKGAIMATSGCKCSSKAAEIEKEEENIISDACCGSSHENEFENDINSNNWKLEEQPNSASSCSKCSLIEVEEKKKNSEGGAYRCSYKKESSCDNFRNSFKNGYEDGSNNCKCSSKESEYKNSAASDYKKGLRKDDKISNISSSKVRDLQKRRSSKMSTKKEELNKAIKRYIPDDVIKAMVKRKETAVKKRSNHQIDAKKGECSMNKQKEEGCNFVFEFKNLSDKKKQNCKSAETCKNECPGQLMKYESGVNDEKTNLSINIGVSCTESASKTTICTTVFSIKPESRNMSDESSSENLSDSCDLSELNKTDDDDLDCQRNCCNKAVGCNFNKRHYFNIKSTVQMEDEYRKKMKVSGSEESENRGCCCSYPSKKINK